MFSDILSKYFHSWPGNQKLLDIYSGKKVPDIILTFQNTMALGLKYDMGKMNAPIVLLKGQNLYAQKIIDACKLRNVTVIDQPGLVTKLYHKTGEGSEIPRKFYEAVANIYSTYQLLQNNNTVPIKNNFDETSFKQRNKELEMLSINAPEKVELQLGKNLFELVKGQCFQISILGFQITKIKLSENERFRNEEYCIKINGTNVYNGMIRYTAIDPFKQLLLFLGDILTKHSGELPGRDDVFQFICRIGEKYPVLIQETMKYFSIGEIRQVLCGLLREKVSIQNIVTILESMTDFGDKEHNMDLIMENVRSSIGRDICLPYLSDNRTINVIGLSLGFEAMIEKNTRETGLGRIIEPNFYEFLIDLITETVEAVEKDKIKPILLCSTLYRRLLYEAVRNVSPQIVVLSLSEIPPGIGIQYLLMLEIPIQESPKDD